MADSIVSCNSCGKKYRIREGSQAGSFSCTDCGAEVSYGAAAAQPAMARPAQARPARARPARGGQGARRGPSRSRPASRRRDRRYDVEGGPPPKSNTGLYVGLGILGVAVVAAAIIIAVGMGSDGPVDTGPGTDVADNNRTTDPATTTPEEEPYKPSKRPPDLREQPEDEPEKPSDTQPEVKPRDTDNPEKIKKPDRTRKTPENFYEATRRDLIGVKYSDLVKQLKHLDDTPADLRREIDQLCATIVDFNAGSDGIDAQARLAEIGKPAVPMILAAFAKAGDLASREGMINACFVDETLRGVVFDSARLAQLKQFHQPGKSQILRTAKYWCIWWYTKGHKMEKYITDEEEGDEDE